MIIDLTIRVLVVVLFMAIVAKRMIEDNLL
jgi:hypothetical protein